MLKSRAGYWRFCGSTRDCGGAAERLKRALALKVFELRAEPVIGGIATLITTGFPISVRNLRDRVVYIFLGDLDYFLSCGGNCNYFGGNSGLGVAGAGNASGRGPYRARLFNRTYSLFGGRFFGHGRLYHKLY